jgi:hypothetical protein
LFDLIVSVLNDIQLCEDHGLLEKTKCFTVQPEVLRELPPDRLGGSARVRRCCAIRSRNSCCSCRLICCGGAWLPRIPQPELLRELLPDLLRGICPSAPLLRNPQPGLLLELPPGLLRGLPPGLLRGCVATAQPAGGTGCRATRSRNCCGNCRWPRTAQ